MTYNIFAGMLKLTHIQLDQSASMASSCIGEKAKQFITRRWIMAQQGCPEVVLDSWLYTGLRQLTDISVTDSSPSQC